MTVGRKLVPTPKGGNKPRKQQGQAKPAKKPAGPSRSLLNAGDRAYARLLADPCNAPIVPGLVTDGTGTNVQRFVTDQSITLGPTDNAVNICICPSAMAIRHGFSSSDSANITFNSGYAYPGSGIITAQGQRYRCLAACAQISWIGTEQNRQGLVALGNAPQGGALSTTTTTAEVRSGLAYVNRLPDTTVGIKWRPNDNDLDWIDAAYNPNNVNAMWIQVSGLPVNTTVLRLRVVVVMEWDNAIQFGAGTPIPLYVAPSGASRDRLSKALAWLDKTGHWLLENGAALGQSAYNAMHLLAM